MAPLLRLAASGSHTLATPPKLRPRTQLLVQAEDSSRLGLAGQLACRLQGSVWSGARGGIAAAAHLLEGGFILQLLSPQRQAKSGCDADRRRAHDRVTTYRVGNLVTGMIGTREGVRYGQAHLASDIRLRLYGISVAHLLSRGAGLPGLLGRKTALVQHEHVAGRVAFHRYGRCHVLRSERLCSHCATATVPFGTAFCRAFVLLVLFSFPFLYVSSVL